MSEYIQKTVIFYMVHRGGYFVPCYEEVTPTGRWKIEVFNGYPILFLECSWEDTVRFYSEEELYLHATKEYPIQECCHE